MFSLAGDEELHLRLLIDLRFDRPLDFDRVLELDHVLCLSHFLGLESPLDQDRIHCLGRPLNRHMRLDLQAVLVFFAAFPLDWIGAAGRTSLTGGGCSASRSGECLLDS